MFFGHPEAYSVSPPASDCHLSRSPCGNRVCCTARDRARQSPGSAGTAFLGGFQSLLWNARMLVQQKQIAITRELLDLHL
jgi:hypothetical protein